MVFGMGCDLLVGKFVHDVFKYPCELEMIRVPTVTERELYLYGDVDDPVTIGEKFDVKVVFISDPESGEDKEVIFVYSGPAQGHVIKEKVLERGKIGNVPYELREVKVALCSMCPLNTRGRVIGVFAPYCSIRTRVYARIAPTLGKIDVEEIDKVIDIIRREAESYKPKTEYEAELKESLLKWLNAVEKHLKGKGLVFYNWC